MAEFTFGSRYDNGLSLLTLITDAGVTYAPSNSDLTVASWTADLSGADTANTLVDNTGNGLSTSRSARQTGIKITLIAISAQVRDEIGSMKGGKKTVAFKSVQKTVQKMRGYKIPKIKNPASAGETPEEKKKVSQSELSFGSIVADAKKILSVIDSLAGYAPSNTDLSAVSYTALIADCEAKNKTVAQDLFKNSSAIDARLELYDGEEGLGKISQQIVDYIASTFKKSSTLYKDAVKLKI